MRVGKQLIAWLLVEQQELLGLVQDSPDIQVDKVISITKMLDYKRRKNYKSN